MKSLKIAFGILLCVTILSVTASVVCAVIAGNTAEYFRDYRCSVTTMLSSLHAQLNDSKEAFADALKYKESLTTEAPTADPETETVPESTEASTEAPEQTDTDAVAKAYTVGVLDGRIGIWDADGKLIRPLNVAVATLPRADREQLAAGIVLTGEDELNALIEDYSG